MKINFHYFVVKCIASRIGYCNEEAQLIASTCQFINDNYQDASIYADISDLSQEIINQNLYEKNNDTCMVPLILTALKSYEDPTKLEAVAVQEEILIPFYYFPVYQIKDDPNYEVDAITGLESNKLFYRHFEKARSLYATSDKAQGHDAGTGYNQKNALVRLGILLHILSDTFVNEPFNGYKSNKNAFVLNEALSTINFENITKNYNPSKYEKYPYVGHYRLGGVESDYNVQYYAQNVAAIGRRVTKNNNSVMEKAARAVYDFLMYFKNEKPTDQDWRVNIFPHVVKGLNTSYSSYEDLKTWWNSLEYYQFDYDADVYRTSLVKRDDHCPPNQQGYFDFLTTLNDIKRSTIQREEQCLLQQTLEATQITCEIEKPIFNGTELSVNSKVNLSQKIDCIAVALTVTEMPSGIQILSQDEQFKNTSKFNMGFTLPIPDEDQEYAVSFDFSWKEKGLSKSYSYSGTQCIKGNKNILATKNLITPCSKSGLETITVVNGSKSDTADYNYSLNDDYTTQQGVGQLDLFLPVDFELKLADNFAILKMDSYAFTLKDALNQVMTYCNNDKYIEININKAAGTLTIKASDEWKNHILVKRNELHKANLLLEVDVNLEVFSPDEEGYRSITLRSKEGKTVSKSVNFLWGL